MKNFMEPLLVLSFAVFELLRENLPVLFRIADHLPLCLNLRGMLQIGFSLATFLWRLRLQENKSFFNISFPILSTKNRNQCKSLFTNVANE